MADEPFPSRLHRVFPRLVNNTAEKGVGLYGSPFPLIHQSCFAENSSFNVETEPLRGKGRLHFILVWSLNGINVEHQIRPDVGRSLAFAALANLTDGLQGAIPSLNIRLSSSSSCAMVADQQKTAGGVLRTRIRLTVFSSWNSGRMEAPQSAIVCASSTTTARMECPSFENFQSIVPLPFWGQERLRRAAKHVQFLPQPAFQFLRRSSSSAVKKAHRNS